LQLGTFTHQLIGSKIENAAAVPRTAESEVDMSTTQPKGGFEPPAAGSPHASGVLLNLHEESSAQIAAPPDQVFSLLDDPTRLTAHMSTRSWRMAWGKMDTVVDGQGGRALGSHIVVRGRVLGIGLYLEEVVTRREPPFMKTWETIGEPRLLVIGPYRMSFTLTPANGHTVLRATIDYALPAKGLARLLGRVFGRAYAQWCTRRMACDVASATER
jgi:hypothetical protein